MGFTDLSQSILKNNRRLRQNLRRKKHEYKVNLPSYNAMEKGRQQLNSVEINTEKDKFIFKEYYILISLSIVLLGIVLFISNKIVVEYDTKAKEKRVALIAESQQKEISRAYHIHLTQGNTYLNTEYLEEAREAFQQALVLIPEGKEANLGLTKVLLLECKRNNKYCEQSKAYFTSLIESSQLSKNDKIELNQFKSQFIKN